MLNKTPENNSPVKIEDNKEDVVTVKREKFEIAIRDIENAEYFLKGLSIGKSDREEYEINNQATRLSNAIQWLHNWGDDNGRK